MYQTQFIWRCLIWVVLIDEEMSKNMAIIIIHINYEQMINDQLVGGSALVSQVIYIYIIENSERSVDIMTCIAANGVLYMNGTDSKSVTLDSGSVQNTQD